MIVRPTTIDELAEVLPQHPRVRLRGGGTKSIAAPVDDRTVTCDLTGLRGVVEYAPEECTFTALAGTPLAEITGMLAAHRQWLPCDPPLGEAGATIGGTVASGLNGSCRYRFGGIRDFIIGGRLVDGRGHVTRSGGKVVKNAAGFLLHQAVVGSCGTLGVVAEITFKVFPSSEAHVTLRAPMRDMAAAVTAMTALQRGLFDLEALDLVADGGPSLLLRLGGFREGLPARVAALQQALGTAATVCDGADDEAVWRDAREFAWVPRDATLVRIPCTLPTLVALDAVAQPVNAPRRYAVAGNLALVAWPDDPNRLDAPLRALGLVGQVVRSPLAGTPRLLGAVLPNPFGERLRKALDPDTRF